MAKEFHDCNCTYYYNKKDKAPFWSKLKHTFLKH